VPQPSKEAQAQEVKAVEQRELTDAESRDYDRRQRDLEKDARAAFWEERVKVSFIYFIFLCYFNCLGV
jgi:hypothetical protein